MGTQSTSHLSLADLMNVEATEDPTIFVDPTESYGLLGIYGGHFFGQALAAGFETVEEPKLAHSFHAYFLRRGDPEAALEYHVTSVRESRSGDTRAISARQNGQDAFHMIASFKLPESGDAHQKTRPNVKPTEALIRAREGRGEDIFPFPMVQGGRVQMEFVGPSIREFDPSREPTLRL